MYSVWQFLNNIYNNCIIIVIIEYLCNSKSVLKRGTIFRKVMLRDTQVNKFKGRWYSEWNGSDVATLHYIENYHCTVRNSK